jgi:uncharacterized membrane protein YdjX (TVP38/TMEM64 family)/rhodanese-related sulfurtransferase
MKAPLSFRGLFAALLFLGLGTLAVTRPQLDPTAISAAVAGLGAWAPVAFIILSAVATVLLIPGTLMGLAGGALFGPWWGTLANLTGATLGATIAFLLARHLVSDWARQKAGARVERLIRRVEGEGWRFVALVRLVPLFPFNVLNYALGLTRIPLTQYVVASLICMLPGTLAFTWLGYAAGRAAISGNTAAIRYGLLALGLLAAIAFVPRLIRRLRGGQSTRWVETRALAEEMATAKIPTPIIDVRDPDEFSGELGHLIGARNIPLAELPQRLAELETLKGESLVLLCHGHARSAKGAALITEAGFTHVRVLRRGMVGWTNLALPVDGAPCRTAAANKPSPVAGPS